MVTTGLVMICIMGARDSSRETCPMIETILVRLHCLYCWNDSTAFTQWIVFLKRHRFPILFLKRHRFPIQMDIFNLVLGVFTIL
jgi:hypothetical protein